VDVALLRREPDGGESVFSSLVDPGVPIPIEASDVHHITDDMVRGQPTFKDIAPKLIAFIGDADLGGFNVGKFDIPLLAAEFKRAGFEFSAKGRRVLDAFTIFQRKEPRNLSAAYKFYCGKNLEGAHRAEADAKASFEIFESQLARYPDLPKDFDSLSEMLNAKDPRFVDAERKFMWRNGQAAFAFGKHRGLSLEEVSKRDPGYLDWLMGTPQATPELVQICGEARKGRYPVKK
jgi:DNA polymerase-3 subunit epsilon